MSEENQGTVEVVIDTGTSIETTQVAPEGEKVEPIVEETLEAKYERVTKERDQAIARAEKTQKGLLKVKRKGQSKAEALAQELSQTKSRLHEYTGAEIKEQQQPTQQEQQLNAEYKVRVEDLTRDKTFLKLHNDRAQAGNNPFMENPLIDRVFASRGIDPRIATTILEDDDLCERLGDADDAFEIVALVELAKDRKKNKASKAKEDVKPKKPVNEPKAIPSLKVNNNSANTNKAQSTEDWYAQKYGNK